MKVVAILGTAPNQMALASKLNLVRGIDQLIKVERPPNRARRSFRGILTAATVGLPFRVAWKNLMSVYRGGFDWPDAPSITVPSANAQDVIEVLKQVQPDLILVSGTDLLRENVIKVAVETGRIINLHTGISPYIKGGPNCTNWALFLGRPDLIGNTIMWLDSGIDTGNLISTERTPGLEFRSLSALHFRVMEHAHDLYCRSYKAVLDGEKVPSVPQSSLGKGRLFLSKHWTGAAMLRAIINFQRMRLGFRSASSDDISLVDLKTGNRISGTAE